MPRIAGKQVRDVYNLSPPFLQKCCMCVRPCCFTPASVTTDGTCVCVCARGISLLVSKWDGEGSAER